jgi:hypothetical protein
VIIAPFEEAIGQTRELRNAHPHRNVLRFGVWATGMLKADGRASPNMHPFLIGRRAFALVVISV